MRKQFALIGADTARTWERENNKQRHNPGSGFVFPRDKGVDDAEQPFFNNGDDTIGAYHLMRVDGEAERSGFPIPACKRADTTFGFQWLVNGRMPVEPKKLGTAQGGRVVLFSYAEGTTMVTKRCYGPMPGQGTAALSPLGLLQLIKIEDSAKRWARGFVRQINAVVGKSDSDINPLAVATPGQGTLKLWRPTGGASDTWAATTMQAPVLNFSAQEAAMETFLIALEAAGHLHLVFESCGA